MNLKEELERHNEIKLKKIKKRRAKKLPVSLSNEEYILLLKKTKKKVHALAFILGAEAGLRISEVLKLEPRHFEFSKSKGGLNRIRIEEGKGLKDRTTPIPKKIKEIHLKYFPLKIGERALQRAFKRICKKAGLLEKKPNLHFHSLRHYFASELMRRGLPLSEIQAYLGHSNISTTGIYLHANPEEALRNYYRVFR